MWPRTAVTPRIGTVAYTGPGLDVQALRAWVCSQKVNMTQLNMGEPLSWGVCCLKSLRRVFPGLWANGMLLQGSITGRGSICGVSFPQSCWQVGPGRQPRQGRHQDPGPSASPSYQVCGAHLALPPTTHPLLGLGWGSGGVMEAQPFPHPGPGEAAVFAVC